MEKVAWIWAIALAFAVPQIASFLRCLRKFLFKFNEWPRVSVLVFVTMMESLHTAGLAILSYLVLPHLDAVKGLLLTSALAIGDIQSYINTFASAFPPAPTFAPKGKR